MSNREKRIIEVRGEIKFLKETIHDILYKENVLDELEELLLDEAVKQLREFELELERLRRGN